MTTMTLRPFDLEARVANRKLELIAEIIEHKKNSSRFGAAAEIDRIKARLADLAVILKESVVDGWGNVGSSGRDTLDQWLAR